MRAIIIFAVSMLAAGMVVPKYAAQLRNPAPAPAAVAHSATLTSATSSGPREVTIQPGRNGHFQVEGRVDGRRIDFMVDTGASVVALSARDAAMLGIHPAQSDFTAMVRTANGAVRAAPIELSMVEIDDLVVRNVAAMVMPDGALSDNLLGLSFLSRLHRYEYSSGRLVLEQ